MSRITLNKWMLVLTCIILSSFSLQAQDDILKVMSYNILNFPSSSGETRTTDFKDIVHHTNPDVILIQELKSSAGATDLVNAVNTNGITYYQRDPNFQSYLGLGNMLIYNADKITLLASTEIPSYPRGHTHYHAFLNDPDLACHQDTTFIELFSVHFKASSGSSNESTRADNANDLVDYIDLLPTTSNIIVGGDFNIYSPSETAYDILTLPANVMPLTDPMGGWVRNSSSYVDMYTQSTRSGTNTGGNGGATGGLDDRFDFQFIGDNIQSGAEGLTYMNNSYEVVGNDGNHFNLAIIEGSANTAVPANIAQALFNMSDHYPVLTQIEVDYPNTNLAVTGLNTTNIMTSTATANWNVVSSAISYNVQYRPVGSSTWTTTSAASNTTNLSGLAACTEYEFQVQVVCSGGNTSAFSNSSTFTTATQTPTGLAANNVTAAAADMNWNVSTSASSYNIQYRPVGASTWNTQSTTNTTYILAGLTPCTDYECQIQVVCGSGASSSFTAPITFSTSALIPNALSAINVTDNSADFSWSAVTNAASYNINYRVVGTSTWTNVNSTTAAYNVNGLAACTDYEFQVEAVCASGSTSGYSANTTFSTGITTPNALSSSNVTAAAAEITWTGSTGAANYNIQFRPLGTSTWTTTNTSNTTYILAGLAPCTDYEYAVQAECSSNSTSSFSTTDVFSTAPLVAVGLSASNTTGSSADLSWSATTNAASYDVQYRPVGTTTWTTINTSSAMYTLTGLNSCTNYEFQVSTVCGSGSSSIYSGITGFSTINCITVVSAQMKVILEGAYNGATMNNSLQQNNLIPLTQPYNIAPWNYTGNESVGSLSAIPANTVDWVLVELRNAANWDVLEDTKAGFLLSNGSVVNTDGTAISFANAVSGTDYYMVVRHRNHVDIMSSQTVNLPNTITYDFTTIGNVMAGSNQVKALGGGVYGLHAGDISADGIISVEDFNFYKLDLSQLNSYLDTDISLDGNVLTQDFNLYRSNASVIGIRTIRY